MPTGMTHAGASQVASQAEGNAPRRRRRSREDIDHAIRTAARTLFARQGYAATTTREIAEGAEVSETLLFRYFGDKARLFEAVINDPFTQAVKDFEFPHDPGESTRGPLLRIYDLLEENRELLRALVFGGPPPYGQGDHPASGFEPFLQAATKDLRRTHHDRGINPQFDTETGVRLGFGMVASAVLMRDWLFPAGQANPEAVLETLQLMVERGLETRTQSD